MAPTAKNLTGSACGLRLLMGGVAASAARAWMMGAGHWMWPALLKIRLDRPGPRIFRSGQVPPEGAPDGAALPDPCIGEERGALAEGWAVEFVAAVGLPPMSALLLLFSGLRTAGLVLGGS